MQQCYNANKVHFQTPDLNKLNKEISGRAASVVFVLLPGKRGEGGEERMEQTKEVRGHFCRRCDAGPIAPEEWQLI